MRILPFTSHFIRNGDMQSFLDRLGMPLNGGMYFPFLFIPETQLYRARGTTGTDDDCLV